MVFKRKKNETNKSSINAQTISADVISINNEYGHFEIGDYTGKNLNLVIDNYVLVFKGGILVDIKPKEDN